MPELLTWEPSAGSGTGMGDRVGLFPDVLLCGFMTLTLDTYLTCDQKSCCLDLECGLRA